MTFFEKYIYDTGNRKKNELLAYEYLVTDTLAKNLTGPTKSKQVTALDNESKLMNTIVPSMIYTFKYDNPTVNDTVKKLTFKDYVPIIFCMYIDSAFIYGLNLNFIPNDIRAAVLDAIIKTNPNFYNKEIYTTGVINNKDLISVLMNEDSRKQFLKLLSSAVDVDITQAYRKYNKKYITNIRLIEYDVWEYIPYLSFTDAVRGAKLIEVQKAMIES